MAEWTFLTNHAVVLLHISANPGARLRDIAAAAGITERAVQQIVRDLGEAGYVTATRVGRRNQYTVHPQQPMRHLALRRHDVGALIDVLNAQSTPSPDALPPPSPGGRSSPSSPSPGGRGLG